MHFRRRRSTTCTNRLHWLQLLLDRRFEEVNRRFVAVDQRFETLTQEMKCGFDALKNVSYGLGSRWGLEAEVAFRGGR